VSPYVLERFEIEPQPDEAKQMSYLSPNHVSGAPLEGSWKIHPNQAELVFNLFPTQLHKNRSGVRPGRQLLTVGRN
jgi:hypothetical protein